ncbi:MAG: 4Fe-4S cluster-binding domain-containing protein [Fusobacterium sp.]
MLLREPYYMENMGRDQPYLSMLLIAPYCTFKCKGCQNKHLGQNQTKNFSTKELQNIYKSNPFFQGVTIAGLEIFDSGEKFQEDFINFISYEKITKVTVYTRYKKDSKEVLNLVKKIKALKNIENFYIKTGEFRLQEKNENTVKIGNWEILLYNKEQDFQQLI